ncbi:MAG: tRNA-dihydrouridine synthase, partial [Candidatus Omnitrophota bacterium]|nr:tRNA-dihydrouridine synthase [Candidatus Omnitrophota bacterium]
LGRPWIFRQINAYLKGKEAVSGPSFNELKNLIREHFFLCVEFYGDRRTFPRMYKHLAWYLAPFKNLGYIMNEYTGVRDASAFTDFINRLYLDESNRLMLSDG